MSSGHPRRVSTAPIPGFTHVPPAPPLPPLQPRYQHGARFAIGRVLGFGGKHHHQDTEKRDFVPFRATSLTNTNATAIHRTGLAISSLSINESGTHALVAGKDVFKTIRVDGSSCAEDVNIRAAISSYNANVNETDTRPKDALELHDVAWAKGTTGNIIAAATINGPIILYDLNRLGIEIARLFDHRRQVHRVTFNPHAGHYMLSASQDGTVRMWDIRDHQRNVISFSSQRSIPGQNEGIRDVKWSPTNGTEFALGTDAGWIMKYDTQMMRTPKTRISGHAGVVNTIDWHPDGKHLLSAGSDKAVRVWNVYNETRRHRPAHEIKVPHPLRNARWRPSYQSSLHGDPGVRQCTQLVTSYDREYPVLHIWDLRRQHMPFRELECNPTAPTDLLWHSQDLLWTVGREGIFTQSDVSFAQRTVDKRTLQAFAVSAQGDISLVTQTRRPKSEGVKGPPPPTSRPQRQHTDSAVLSAGATKAARSAGDDTLDDNFLSAALNMSKKKKSTPPTESRSSTDTPPSGEFMRGKLLPLDSREGRFRSSRPHQPAARGTLPGSANISLGTFFAQKYKLRPYAYPATVDSFVNIASVFEQNATYAKLASMYRLAQSWRIIGQLVAKDVNMRAAAHRDRRVRRLTNGDSVDESRVEIIDTIQGLLADQAARASNPPTPLAVPVKGNLQAVAAASTSNAPTPRAYPSRARISDGSNALDKDLLDLERDSSTKLPPLLIEPTDRSPSILDHMEGVDSSPENTMRSSSRRAEWRDRPHIHAPSPSRGYPLLDTPPKLTKQDSDESFGVFPLSASSRAGSLTGSMITEQSQLMNMVSENLKAMDESPPQERRLSMRQMEQRYNDRQLAERQEQTIDLSPQIPQIETPETPAPNSMEIEAAIAVPERPRSRADVTRDMQALAQNNQESFTSDTDIDPSSQKETSAVSTEPDNITDDGKLNGVNTTRAPSHESRQRPTMHKYKSLFDPTEGVFVKSREQSPDPVQQELIVEDFLARGHSESKPTESIFPLAAMLQQLITYHTTNIADAQSLAAMLLLTVSLLPEVSPLQTDTVRLTLTHYIDHLSSLQMSDSSIATILSTSTAHLLLSGTNPLQVECILQTYHDQLLSLGLPINAALLRRLSYPTYPSVYDTGLKENQLSFRCSTCRKPLPANTNASRKKCDSCSTRPRQCPVCWMPESPYDLHRGKKKKRRSIIASHGAEDHAHHNDHLNGGDATRLSSIYTHHTASRPTTGYGEHLAPRNGDSTGQADHDTGDKKESEAVTLPPSLFTACLNCNHSAHAACLAVWHGLDALPGPGAASSPAVGGRGRGQGMISEGICPVEGCGCPCISAEAMTGSQGGGGLERSGSGFGLGRGAGKVVEDDVRVGESRAVVGARRSLGGFGTRLSGASGRSGLSGDGGGGSAGSGGVRSLENLR